LIYFCHQPSVTQHISYLQPRRYSLCLNLALLKVGAPPKSRLIPPIPVSAACLG
jgi:hypothetical protein